MKSVVNTFYLFLQRQTLSLLNSSSGLSACTSFDIPLLFRYSEQNNSLLHTAQYALQLWIFCNTVEWKV